MAKTTDKTPEKPTKNYMSKHIYLPARTRVVTPARVPGGAPRDARNLIIDEYKKGRPFRDGPVKTQKLISLNLLGCILLELSHSEDCILDLLVTFELLVGGSYDILQDRHDLLLGRIFLSTKLCLDLL